MCLADSDPTPLFALGQDETSNAHLPWAFEAWESYISGYRDAARALVADLESLVPEWAFFPIAFLYRHCVELQLKSVVLNGQRLLGLPGSAPCGHDLRGLWTEARVLVVQAGFDVASDSLARTDQTIAELTTADPSGQSFRYPLDRKGLPTLPTVSGVNIRALSARMDELVNFLLGLNEALHIQMQDNEESEEEEVFWLGGY